MSVEQKVEREPLLPIRFAIHGTTAATREQFERGAVADAIEIRLELIEGTFVGVSSWSIMDPDDVVPGSPLDAYLSDPEAVSD